MASYKTTGIVLKTRKLGEADRIIILFTATRGKVDAVAKGIRRTKSKFGARLEPFSEGNLFLYEGRNLDIVTQAELIHSNQSIRENLSKLSFGWAILNLAEITVNPGQADSQSYNLLEKTLRQIDQGEVRPDFGLLQYALHISRLQGVQPNFESCAECGKPYQKGSAHFSFSRGGLICQNCKKSILTDTLISSEDLELMKKASSSVVKLKASKNSQAISENEVKYLLQLIHRYLEFHLHSKLRGWDFIK